MSNKYVIEVTEEQLHGLMDALTAAPQFWKAELRKREASVAFWQERQRADMLPVVNSNMDYAQARLAAIAAASSAVYSAKLLTPSPAPSPLPETAKQAAPSSPSLDGERGMLPPANVRAAGGPSDCNGNCLLVHALTDREAH